MQYVPEGKCCKNECKDFVSGLCSLKVFIFE